MRLLAPPLALNSYFFIFRRLLLFYPFFSPLMQPSTKNMGFANFLSFLLSIQSWEPKRVFPMEDKYPSIKTCSYSPTVPLSLLETQPRFLWVDHHSNCLFPKHLTMLDGPYPLFRPSFSPPFSLVVGAIPQNRMYTPSKPFPFLNLS